jgi:hypothetical protein
MIESKPFVPKTPGSSTYVAPLNAATVTTTTPTLSFKVQFAHYVDVYYGTSPSTLTLYKSNMKVNCNSTVNVILPALVPGTYYWKVLARTAANKTSTGSTYSFQVQ